MKLIAESGSTKTEWRLIGTKVLNSYRGEGINPVFLSSEEIEAELGMLKAHFHPESLEEIHFYGAGVTDKDARNKLLKAFERTFQPEGKIFINDDLLAAARALFGNGSGIACIMGTGSNSCLFKDGKIEDKIPALGYILGDEGSGTDIGKRFLNALLKKDFSPELTEKILSEHPFSIEEIISNVYRKPLANRYLSSLTHIVVKNLEYPEIRNIVKLSFQNFLQKNASKYKNYKNYKIGFVGSVAYHFSEILTEALIEEGFHNSVIIEHPVEKLTNYHINY